MNYLTLDLHGLFHDEVNRTVFNFVFANSQDIPLRIVTGNSPKMKSIAIGAVEELGYSWHFEHWVESGAIIVT
tara:strand:- start:430 stop:648 length:219 start_codon:yes stop_codon:yes gene_type:complete